MPLPYLLYLVLQTLIFLAWAAMMFYMLWKISVKARAMNDPGDGPSAQISNRMSAFLGFFPDPANRRFLRRLAAVTVLMVTLNILGATLVSPT